MIIQDLSNLDKHPACIRVPRAHSVPSLEDDIRHGLLSRPRSLPPKYFYDDLGSQLFELICDTEEYYPTRTEAALLQRHAASILAHVKPDYLLELGSGSSRKTRLLFDACESMQHYPVYWPFDVCEPMLESTARDLQEQYDWLDVQPLAGDYSGGLTYLPRPSGRCLYVFLGSSIGNFSHQEAQDFVREIRRHMRAGDSFLLGVDRVKAHDVLHAAYNDSQGITADFNLNVLNVLNREMGSDFDVDGFSHKAVFNTQQSQIEMYLVADKTHEVSFNSLDQTLQLEQGEHILTEISRKYSVDDIKHLFAQADLDIVHHYEPENGYFSLMLAQCR